MVQIKTVVIVLIVLAVVATVAAVLYSRSKADEKCKAAACTPTQKCEPATGECVERCLGANCGHGTCEPTTGKCNCRDGFTGDHCEIMPSRGIRYGEMLYIQTEQGLRFLTDQSPTNPTSPIVRNLDDEILQQWWITSETKAEGEEIHYGDSVMIRSNPGNWVLPFQTTTQTDCGLSLPTLTRTPNTATPWSLQNAQDPTDRGVVRNHTWLNLTPKQRTFPIIDKQHMIGVCENSLVVARSIPEDKSPFLRWRLVPVPFL